MAQILAFIVAFMQFLWEHGRFSITGSMVTTSNGGDSYLIVESRDVRLRFIRDRGQLFLDLQPAFLSTEWFSVDLIRRLVLGAREPSAVLDESFARFLESELDQVTALFAPTQWPATRGELMKLRSLRASEMFHR